MTAYYRKGDRLARIKLQAMADWGWSIGGGPDQYTVSRSLTSEEGAALDLAIPYQVTWSCFSADFSDRATLRIAVEFPSLAEAYQWAADTGLTANKREV